jgi:hypothetical protein
MKFHFPWVLISNLDLNTKSFWNMLICFRCEIKCLHLSQTIIGVISYWQRVAANTSVINDHGYVPFVEITSCPLLIRDLSPGTTNGAGTASSLVHLQVLVGFALPNNGLKYDIEVAYSSLTTKCTCKYGYRCWNNSALRFWICLK